MNIEHSGHERSNDAWGWETNKKDGIKVLVKFSQLYLNERMKDKKLEENIFQDDRGRVAVPNEEKVSYWLRRQKRENASEKTFFVARPQRPLRFRTIPPLLFPVLYALPALIGGNQNLIEKHCSQELELAWLSSVRGRLMGRPCPHLLLPVTLFSLFADSIFFFRNVIFII